MKCKLRDKRKFWRVFVFFFFFFKSLREKRCSALNSTEWHWPDWPWGLNHTPFQTRHRIHLSGVDLLCVVSGTPFSPELHKQCPGASYLLSGCSAGTAEDHRQGLWCRRNKCRYTRSVQSSRCSLPKTVRVRSRFLWRDWQNCTHMFLDLCSTGFKWLSCIRTSTCLGILLALE